MRMIQDPQQIDEIDDFLAAIEMFLPLDDVGNVMPAQGIQVGIGLRELPKEQRHVARFHGRAIQNLVVQPPSQHFTLGSGRSCRIEGLCFTVRRRDAEPHARLDRRRTTLGTHLQTDVRRLDQRPSLEQPIENLIHRLQHRRVASKIRRQRLDHSTIRRHFLHDSIEGFDVGAPEGIDRLLGIPHNEEFSRVERHLMPMSRLAPGPLGDGEDDFVLHRVGILKLIDQ